MRRRARVPVCNEQGTRHRHACPLGRHNHSPSINKTGRMILLALGTATWARANACCKLRARRWPSGVHVVAASSVHETPAVMPEGAPAEWNRPYLNQVLQVQTALMPVDLLAA